MSSIETRAPRPGGADILIVDDEPANRRLLREVLDRQGYSLREAADGEEALERVAEKAPDLILLDIMMPRRSGYSVCMELKENPATRLIPIIILTTLDQLSNKIAAVERGADDYLNKPFNVLELTTRVRSLLKLKHYTDELENAATVLQGLAQTVEHRDAYTGDHCKRLGTYATAVGTLLKLDDEALARLRLGGILHDLGKIAVPDAILNKPGKLTAEEFDLVRKHPVVGDELARPMRTLEKILPLIRHHHERLDGSGYPDGLKGDDLSLEVRIITVVDVFDALATDRSYKTALPRHACFDILRDGVRKGWWDGDVVEALRRIIGVA